jgi:hypothetical protein
MEKKLTTEETAKVRQLQSLKDTVERRLKQEADQFFIYGLVKQIEDLDRKIFAITNTQPS